MAKINQTTIRDTARAIWNTIIWGVFILVGAFAALSLRGNIHFDNAVNVFLGNVLAAFVIGALFKIVYKAHKEK